MGKGKHKPPVLVLSSSSSSSSSDDAADHGRRRRRRKAPTSEPNRKRPRGRATKGSANSTSSLSSRSHRRVTSTALSTREVEPVKFDMLSEDFSDCLNVFCKVTDNDSNKLWVDKYKPHSSSELAIHRKKVKEVKTWMEDRLKVSKGSGILLITGQAGIGKSTAVHVIASELGVELYEWQTPTPTLWQEHIYNSNLGTRYISKLDEFESFVEKVRKYPLLCPTSTGRSSKPTILFIDDLPVAHGRVALERLIRCLTTIAQSTQMPTVISITEYCVGESNESSSHYWDDIESSLEKAGAYKVAFNPLTVNSIKKTLCQICQEENYKISMELLEQIAEASNGDIRHAVSSLQYCCIRSGNLSSSMLPAISAHTSEMTEKLSTCPYSTATSSKEPSGNMLWSVGRDESLTLFHALGKFLHNKRETTESFHFVPEPFLLLKKLVRNPLKMESPEKILSQAHAQARTVADFLHENVLDFISEDTIDDASIVTSYLSDADSLLTAALRPTWPRTMTENYESESLAQSVSASIAARGVLFGNSRPSSGWHAIRRPKLWQIDQSCRRNKHQVMKGRFGLNASTTSCSLKDIVTEYLPRTKWLESCMLNHDDRETYVCHSNEGDYDQESEDEIED